MRKGNNWVVTGRNYIISDADAGGSRCRRACRRPLLAAALAALAGGLMVAENRSALAGPQGANVLKGTAGISQQGNSWFITASNGAVIQFSSFNISPIELVQFLQPGSTSAVLNLIPFSGNPTTINGSLLANGVVYFVNPNGVVFGNNAVVNVGGIYAAAASIGANQAAVDTFANTWNSAVLAGNPFTFNLVGDVDVLGGASISAGVPGVHLLGQRINNAGSISATGGGMIALIAQNGDVTLTSVGTPDSHYFVNVAAGHLNNPGAGNVGGTGITNTGSLSAPGGQITLAAGDVYSLAIRLEDTGNFNISGEDVAFHGADGIELGSDVEITATGTASFHTTINAATAGNQGLSIVGGGGTGNAIFEGNIGTSKALNHVSVAGTTEFNFTGGAGSVVTTQNQTYTGAVTLGADTTLESTGAGTIEFDGSVNGDSALTVNTAGALTFGAAVGNATALASFERLGGGATAINGGQVRTSGLQNYGAGAVTLGSAATSIESTAGGAITFGGTVNGNSALTVNTNGLLTFGDAVGGGVALTSFTRTGGGETQIDGGLVRTTGAQNYGAGTVTLGAATVLDGGSLVTAGLDLDADDNNLTLTIGAQVAVSNANFSNVQNFLSNGAGGTLLGSFTTGGTQTYSNAVALDGAAVTLASTGNAAILFNNTVNGNSALTVNTGGLLTFGDAVGNTTALTSFERTGGGATQIDGSLVRTAGAQDYGAGTVTLGANTTLEGGSLVTAGLDLNADGNDLTLTFGSQVAVSNANFSNVQNFLSNGAGGTLLGSFTTGGTQTYSNAVALDGAAVTLASTGNAAILFNNTVNGNSALTVNTGGLLTFGDAVGNTTALTSFERTGGGETQIDGGLVRTTGAQNYGAGTVTLGAATVLDGGSLVTAGLDLDADGNDLTLTIGAQVAVSNANFSNVQNFLSNGAGGTLLGSFTTGGTQTYSNAVALDGAAVTLASTGNAAILFNNTVNGNSALTVNTGGLLTFGDAVGNSTALTSFERTGGGATAINGGQVRTTGLQNYGNGVVTLGAAATSIESTGGGTIDFGGTLNGNSALTVTTSGALTFGGAVGNTTALASIARAGGGSTAINGGQVRTSGLQNYGAGAVTLGAAATTIQSTGAGAITFGGTVNGNSALTVNTGGALTFGDAVGNATPLISFERAGGGTTAINGGQVTTTGLQHYGSGGVSLGGPALTTLASTGGGAITFGGAITGNGRDITVNTNGVTTFAAITGVDALETDAGGSTIFNGAVSAGSVNIQDGLTINGGSVTTTGTQQYAAVSLGGAAGSTVTLASSGAGALGNITLGGTLTGANRNLTVNTNGQTSFATVTGVADLMTDAGGTTIFNGTVSAGTIDIGDALTIGGGSVATTGKQTYRDTVTLTANATLSGAATPGLGLAGVAIDFQDAVGVSGGAHNLAIETTNGGVRFGGNVGAGGSALGSLSVKVGGDAATNHANAQGGSIIEFGTAGNTIQVHAAEVFLNHFTDGANSVYHDAQGNFLHTSNAQIGSHGNIIFNTGLFRMGLGQKMTVLGNLTINAAGGQVFLGDLTTLNSMNVTANTINLLLRPKDPNIIGTTFGLDFVAGGVINFNGNVVNFGVGEPALFASSDGVVPAGQVGLILDPPPSLNTLFEGGRFKDLNAQGTSIEDVSDALAGAMPRTEVQSAPPPEIQSDQVLELEAIGLRTRDLSDEERVESTEGRNIFTDVIYDEELEHLVALRRLRPAEAKRVLDLRTTLYERRSDLVVHFEQAWNAYLDAAYIAAEEAAPEDFAAWLGRVADGLAEPEGLSAVEAAQALAGLRDIHEFTDWLEALGLVRKEVDMSEVTNRVLEDFRPPSTTLDEFRQALRGAGSMAP